MYPETQKKIEEMLKNAVFPGVTYTFIDKDKTETRMIGSAAILPEQEALRVGLLYDVASLTKVIVTTTLLLQLHEEGKVNFEDPVQAYLPEFPSDAVTIRHLLTHTSDLKGYIKNRDELPAEELAAALISLEPGENLGKKVCYTDTGLILAGFIIEKLTGKSVEDNFEERIKQPLGMTESTYRPADLLRCVPTQNHPIRGVIRGVVHDPKAVILGGHCGSAGLFAPMQDLIRFSQMLLHFGEWEGQRILRDDSVRSLLQDWGGVPGQPRALGWNLFQNGENFVLWHTGYTGTFMILDPMRQKGFVLLSNRVHLEDRRPEWIAVRDELIAIYLKEALEEKAE
ncbi:CubicO group peptidase (beta-lactamase class C family) [Trichococcus patagoniensis]|uniref:CubicO group peptidase (Beta-lactamase class C family) n=2 Tax=Trichococcus patagoniensis TaxID=382641 RepID=A0A2T5IPK6_9LACT|nr:CubicO group peptidase (beta-lactamase class C family) [Trichococcus patagoniensis]